jgi:class 3 adenylate cyclase
MKETLRQALEEAVGTTEFLIIAVGDIRGFTGFSLNHESEEVALVLKRVFIKLIDEYFPFADYFNTTGDGLLLGIHYDEKDVKEKAQATVRACLNAVRDFPKFCKNDPMINFQAPERIGFGVARGAACALVSDGKVIDYTGDLPNLAARLQDLARPKGVVLDSNVGIELLPPATRRLFRPDKVYLRSIAERQPRSIHVLKSVVEIPAAVRKPIRGS